MEPPSSSLPTPASGDSQPEATTAKPQRNFPIKGLIIFLVAAQPVLVAISLFYTEVINKKDPPKCDPALHAALEVPAPLPDSSYYKADPAAQAAYEEGWATGYREMVVAILEGGCNGAPPKLMSGYASPIGTVESARANGRNDGALKAQQVPRECLNQCWRLVIRRTPQEAPAP